MRARCRRRRRCARASSIRAFDWGATGRRRPRGATRVIYELHVKGFTRLHPAVPEEWRGKYLGLTVAPVIEHLKSIGVTAVELLPCQSFVSEPFLLDRGLKQLLGLQPDRVVRAGERVRGGRCRGRIQDHGQGAACRPASRSFSTWCSTTPPRATRAGPLLSLRGIDNSVYYRLMPGQTRIYENLTRLRQHRQLRASAGARADHRLPEVLGRGDARRRLSLRSGDGAGARRQRLQCARRRSSRRCAPSRRSPTSS